MPVHIWTNPSAASRPTSAVVQWRQRQLHHTVVKYAQTCLAILPYVVGTWCRTEIWICSHMVCSTLTFDFMSRYQWPQSDICVTREHFVTRLVTGELLTTSAKVRNVITLLGINCWWNWGKRTLFPNPDMFTPWLESENFWVSQTLDKQWIWLRNINVTSDCALLANDDLSNRKKWALRAKLTFTISITSGWRRPLCCSVTVPPSGESGHHTFLSSHEDPSLTSADDSPKLQRNDTKMLLFRFPLVTIWILWVSSFRERR